MLFRAIVACNCYSRHLLNDASVTCFAHCSRNSRIFCDDSRSKQNLYEVLGISRSSNANEIKSAYYKLSFMYHPDKNIGDKEAVKRFQEIRRAYEILGNNERKQRYDRKLTPIPGCQTSTSECNNTTKIEWMDEDYTSFYRKRNEGRFKKPVQISKIDKNYGSYFRAHPTANVKRMYEYMNQPDEQSKKVNILFVSIVISCGILFVIMFTPLFTRKEKTPPK